MANLPKVSVSFAAGHYTLIQIGSASLIIRSSFSRLSVEALTMYAAMLLKPLRLAGPAFLVAVDLRFDSKY